MTTKLTNQDIYERLYAAISERRLPPGTKLSEQRMAQAVHISRTRVREVLLRLSQELIIELHPNRGAFVASPSREDMHDVFAVRRALERAIVGELSERFQGQAIAPLHSHLAREAQARSEGDLSALARLTGEFHVRLAETTGNRLFTDNLRRLVALTGLIIAQHDTSDGQACLDHEHVDIVQAIEAGDALRAERLMLAHLDHVEHSIRPADASANEIDFGQILRLDAAPQAQALKETPGRPKFLDPHGGRAGRSPALGAQKPPAKARRARVAAK